MSLRPDRERTEQPARVRPGDRERIVAALGGTRYEPIAVVARAPGGEPRVVLALRGRGISPTAYWLVCPRLLSAVSALEAGGEIARIEALVAEDPLLAAAFGRSQALFRRLVYRLFRAELPEVDPGPYLARVRGIGGVADARYIKCLHAHAAFTLATGRGPVGTMVLRRLGLARLEDGGWT